MDDNFFLLAVVSTVVFLLLAVFIFSFLLLFQKRQHENIREKESLKIAYEEEILRSKIEIQNQTLKNIGQDLHDNIGQLLTVNKLYLFSLEEIAKDQESRELINQSITLIDKTIEEVRTLTKSLDSGFVEAFGLIPILSNEISRIQKTKRLSIDLHTTGIIFSIGFQREIILFRIIQEIINNALKHAKATNLLVSLNYESSTIEIIVEDNGTGFDYEAVINNDLKESGAGLQNISRRVKLIGGSCQFITGSGSGTSVKIVIHSL